MKKTAFITGGAKRIGLEICQYFIDQNINVALHYNSSFEKAQNAQMKFGSKCKIFQANLEETQNAISAFKEAQKHFGKIDFLINNASIFKQNSIQNITLQEFERDFSIHLKTPLFLIQEFAKQNFQNEEGLIVNILDKNIIRKNSKYVSYLLSKKSLDELTRFAAFELAPKIRVNSISPGFIIPEETTQINQTEYLEQKLKTIPLKRKGTIQDIVQALDFLIKSNYINGININVDGGSFLFD
jgi:pteridine reductase